MTRRLERGHDSAGIPVFEIRLAQRGRGRGVGEELACQRVPVAAGGWYLQPGTRRLDPQYVAALIDSTSSPHAPWFEQLRRLTMPPQALLVRRMEGLIFTTLGELRAGGDWYSLASEFFADDPPSTELGAADLEHWNTRGVVNPV